MMPAVQTPLTPLLRSGMPPQLLSELERWLRANPEWEAPLVHRPGRVSRHAWTVSVRRVGMESSELLGWDGTSWQSWHPVEDRPYAETHSLPSGAGGTPTPALVEPA